MGLTWQEMVPLQVLGLVISTFCFQGSSRAEGFPLTSLSPHPVLKTLPKAVRILWDTANQRAAEVPGHKVHRVRRSWLSDYMDDLWTHIRISFPRGAIYAFPFAVGVILLLCCATILVD